MGVVYKLKPEIIDFIIEEKKKQPTLGCRNLVSLVEAQFQIKVSKSSINSLIKASGLSMPIGRRLKKKRRKAFVAPVQTTPELKPEEQVEEGQVEEPILPPIPLVAEVQAELPAEMETSGAILLKAADFLLGGSHYLSEFIKNHISWIEEDIKKKTEALTYMPLFGPLQSAKEADLLSLWALIGKPFSAPALLSYLDKLQSVTTTGNAIAAIMTQFSREARFVKVNTEGGGVFYLDGQMHTVWSTPHIPYDFSTTHYSIKSYIYRYLSGEEPMVLFMAPGFDAPTREFFSFITTLDSGLKRMESLALNDAKFKEIELIPLTEERKRYFVFGMWPWQFASFRKVNKIGEFKPAHSQALNKEVLVAEADISLSQPNDSNIVTLRGCAFKMSVNEKIRLVVLSNLPLGKLKPEELLDTYLCRWPNLEEAFQDYSRKIELFTYAASSLRFFWVEESDFSVQANQPESIFNSYLKVLDKFVRWHFLPFGYEDKAFPTIKEEFYDLKASLSREKEGIRVKFNPPVGYPSLKSLEYACRRLNEREILYQANKKIHFSV